MSSLKENLNFNKIQEELNFAVSQEEAEFFSQKLSSYQAQLDLIKNFDFNPYNKYLTPSQDELQTVKFSSLRQDEPVTSDNIDHLFDNCIDFEEGYVVVKNEK